MIDPSILDVLIRAGSMPDPEGLEAARLLNQISTADEINRLHWSTWDHDIQDLSTEDLVALIKALTIAERRFSWIGGSVSAVIRTFRQLEHRRPDMADLVADWILPRTSNPYCPFGSINYGAQSMVEYSIKTQEREQRRKQSRQRAEAENRTAEERRNKRKVYADIPGARQHTDTVSRKANIAELSTLSAPKRLKQISQDHDHAIEYYPVEFACLTEADLELLDDETCRLLLDKLRDRRKSPWKTLHQKLLSKGYYH